MVESMSMEKKPECGPKMAMKWFFALWELLPISVASGLFWLATHHYNFVKSPSLLAPEIDQPHWVVSALLVLASFLLLPFLAFCASKKTSLFLFLWSVITAAPFVLFFGRLWHMLLFVVLFVTASLFLLRAVRFSKILYAATVLLLSCVAASLMSMSLYEAMCVGVVELPQILALVETNTAEVWGYLSKNLFLLVPWAGCPLWVVTMLLFWKPLGKPMMRHFTPEVSMLIGILVFVAVMCAPPAQRFSSVFKALTTYDSLASGFYGNCLAGWQPSVVIPHSRSRLARDA